MMKTKESAFTLIELVITLGILALILNVAYQSLNQISISKKIIDSQRESSMIANSLLSRLSRELQLIKDTRDGVLLPDVEADFIGKTKNLGKDNKGDSITFMADEGGQYIMDGIRHSGLVQISYRAVKNKDIENKDHEVYYLIRDEVPAGIGDWEDAVERTMTFPIAENLVSIEFSYYDKDDDTWLDIWDRPTGIPSIIGFTVKLISESGVINTYSTAIPINNS